MIGGYRGDRNLAATASDADLLAANRRNWDERVAVHMASRFYDVDAGWRRPGPRHREIDALGDAAGLDLVHLQCHFGLDTLAWADAGARVTGLDFSPEAVQAARDLAVRAGLDGPVDVRVRRCLRRRRVLAPRPSTSST